MESAAASGGTILLLWILYRVLYMTPPNDRYLGITASARDLGADRYSLVYDGDARTQGRFRSAAPAAPR